MLLDNMNDINFRVLLNKVYFKKDIFSAYCFDNNYIRNTKRLR